MTLFAKRLRSDMDSIFRNSDGSFPAFTFPGGYPLVYVVMDGGTLCAGCASKHGKVVDEPANCPIEDRQWIIVGQLPHYEGPPEVCDHCGAKVESAYGDQDKSEADQGEVADPDGDDPFDGFDDDDDDDDVDAGYAPDDEDDEDDYEDEDDEDDDQRHVGAD